MSWSTLCHSSWKRVYPIILLKRQRKCWPRSRTADPYFWKEYRQELIARQQTPTLPKSIPSQLIKFKNPAQKDPELQVYKGEV